MRTVMIAPQNHRMIWDGRDIKGHSGHRDATHSSGHTCRAQDGSKQTGDVLAPGVLVRTLISDPRLENEVVFKVFIAFKDLF